MGDYIANRTFINVEGQDTTTVRLKGDRRAWLTLPLDFRPEDVEFLCRHMQLIAALGKDALRPEGPPEPKDYARGRR